MSEETKNPEENSNTDEKKTPKKGVLNKIKDKIKKKETANKKTSEKTTKSKKFVKAPRPDGKKNLDMDALKKASSRMFELQQINRDGLIAIIKKLEKW